MLYEKVIELGKASLIDTSTMNRDEWLKLRTSGIGGSDAGAIMGLNKYATPLSVYLAKKDFSNFSGNAATEWGNILEDPIRQKAREELGIEIETVPGMFKSKEHPFMNANLDGLVFIEGEKEINGSVVWGLGGHEIKTSSRGDGFTFDEIPDAYYAQVQHYMAVTGLQWFILTAFLMHTKEGRHYVIPRNEQFIETLINAEGEFWTENVETNTAPAPTGNENELDLVKSLPIASEIELPAEYEEILNERAEIEKQIKELQGKSEALKESILLKMNELSGGEDSERTTASCGSWKITYNLQTRVSVDTSALKKAGVFEQYSKESSYKVMRISSGK